MKPTRKPGFYVCEIDRPQLHSNVGDIPDTHSISWWSGHSWSGAIHNYTYKYMTDRMWVSINKEPIDLSSQADPEMYSVNKPTTVYFRAGLLAMRELIARTFDSFCLDLSVPQMIRKTWWVILGEDPGCPRKMRWNEISVDNGSGGYKLNTDVSASIEALPVALGFMWKAAPDQIKDEERTELQL